MTEDTHLNHVALQYSDEKQAKIFFTKTLGIPLEKEYTISDELSNAIFNINEQVKILVYNNGKIKFEVFINEKLKDHGYEHVCIEINNQRDFLERCKKYGIKPFLVDKNGRKLLFVRDFSDNLYEIKEKTK